MELELKSRHTSPTGRVRAYAEEKLGEISRYNDGARRVELILDEDKRHGFAAEAIVHMRRGAPIVVHCTAPAAEAAIDRIHDLLERSLRTSKEKVRDKKRGRHGRSGDAGAPVPPPGGEPGGER